MVAAKVVDRFVNLPYNYYRYELNAEQRADYVAHKYYGDQFMSWTVYYANKTVDPYHQWFRAEEDFLSLIVDKYGSIDDAQTRIVEFRSNWYQDDRELSPSNYNAMFGDYKEPHSKYWAPNYAQTSDRIVSYSRRQSDNIVNTNKLVRVAVSNNSTSKLTYGDLVDLKAAPNGSTLATAEVFGANSTVVTLKNYLGSTITTGWTMSLDTDATTYVAVSNSATSNDLTSSVWTLTNISDEEYVYWTPITAFEMEAEKNDMLKTIKLIDGATAIRISDRLEEELSS